MIDIIYSDDEINKDKKRPHERTGGPTRETRGGNRDHLIFEQL